MLESSDELQAKISASAFVELESHKRVAVVSLRVDANEPGRKRCRKPMLYHGIAVAVPGEILKHAVVGGKSVGEKLSKYCCNLSCQLLDTVTRTDDRFVSKLIK